MINVNHFTWFLDQYFALLYNVITLENTNSVVYISLYITTTLETFGKTAVLSDTVLSCISTWSGFRGDSVGEESIPYTPSLNQYSVLWSVHLEAQSCAAALQSVQHHPSGLDANQKQLPDEEEINTNTGSVWASLQHTALSYWVWKRFFFSVDTNPRDKKPPPLYFILMNE